LAPKLRRAGPNGLLPSPFRREAWRKVAKNGDCRRILHLPRRGVEGVRRFASARGGPAVGMVGARRPRGPLPPTGGAGECERGTFCAPAPPGGGPGRLAKAAMTDLKDEYAKRAAIFRRLADGLKSEEDRAALLAIAEEYETESGRLKRAGEGP